MTAASSAQAALELAGPLDHHEQLHHGQHGTVLYWERAIAGRPQRWRKIHPTASGAPEVIRSYAGQSEAYISVNQFDGWRLVKLLRSLRAVYVDVDGCTDVRLALDALSEARMPAPSIAVHSGRGLHLYWLLHPAPPNALPLWQRIEDALVHALEPIGGDPRAKDCTRVLRVAGTVHTGAGLEVRGQILSGERWTLHELADEVLGQRSAKSRGRGAEVRDIRPRQQSRTGAKYGRWFHVYRDLYRIAEHHGGALPEGSRDTWIFLTALALSWFAAPDSLADEIQHAARLHTSLSPGEVAAYVAPVIKRAQRAAAGETIEWGGQQVDPRYRFRRETLYRWCALLIDDDLLPRLRAIIPDSVARDRKRERDSARSNQSREEYEAPARARRAQVRELAAQDLSQRAIAKTLGVSRATIQRDLRE